MLIILTGSYLTLANFDDFIYLDLKIIIFPKKGAEKGQANDYCQTIKQPPRKF